jgi:RimJ/RimL family protein N-acetyltransferase
VIALAFSLLDLDLLTASHLARNPASGRVLGKCGLKLLRTERRAHRGVDEAFCARGLTRSAWEREAGDGVNAAARTL